MASTKLAKAAPTRSSGRSAALAKARAQVAMVRKSAAARLRKKETQGMLLALGGAAGFAALDSRVNLPKLMRLDNRVTYGALLGVVAPMLLKGRAGEALAAAGTGILSAAADRIGRGESVLGADPYEVSGDPYEVSGDPYDND